MPRTFKESNENGSLTGNIKKKRIKVENEQTLTANSNQICTKWVSTNRVHTSQPSISPNCHISHHPTRKKVQVQDFVGSMRLPSI